LHGAYLYAFQFKNNISFFRALWILFNLKFGIGSFSIQLHAIESNESNWIQLNPKKSIRYLKYSHSDRKKFQSILIYFRLLGSETWCNGTIWATELILTCPSGLHTIYVKIFFVGLCCFICIPINQCKYRHYCSCCT